MQRPPSLPEVIAVLRAHEADLRRRGVCHAAVFGSVARDEQSRASDNDVLVDLDPDAIPDLFTYAGIARELREWLGRDVDLAQRRMLKRHVRPAAEREAVYAF